eukprot:TRINITY_DN7194_c0_g1_i4.p2 TRINITY_DN7194_c0_g1~~TRINITY_DN7194_c0_g1_i4.p2  ORF type:complete len:127 (+),score=20.12 TRINITY_DN7194_c0_g1_i4:1869-2249(+)
MLEIFLSCMFRPPVTHVGLKLQPQNHGVFPRFLGYSARDQNKVLTRIHCPLELNVGNSDSKGSNTLRYELCGLVNHSGSLQGGHYTAQCKHACNKQWYEYNDAIVEPIATPSRPSSKVYLAFYLRN